MTNYGYKIAVRNINNVARFVLLEEFDGIETLIAICTGDAFNLLPRKVAPVSIMRGIHGIAEDSIPCCTLEL